MTVFVNFPQNTIFWVKPGSQIFWNISPWLCATSISIIDMLMSDAFAMLYSRGCVIEWGMSREWSPCIDFSNFSMQQSRFLYYSSCFTVKLLAILLHCLKVFVRVRIKLKNPNSMFIC